MEVLLVFEFCCKPQVSPHRFGVLRVSLCISAVMAISFLPVMHCQKTFKNIYIFRGTTACQWGSTSSKFGYILRDNICMYFIYP